FPKGLLSPLAIFDVDSGSIPSEELSGFIAQRYIGNKPPAIFSVCPPNPRFTLHGLPVLNGCVPIGDDPRPVIGMKNRFPLPPERFRNGWPIEKMCLIGPSGRTIR